MEKHNLPIKVFQHTIFATFVYLNFFQFYVLVNLFLAESLLHDSGELEEKNVTRIHEHKEDQSSKEHGKTQSIIDLDGDDECANTAEQGERSPREVFSASDFIWHYVDPHGSVQGPFPLISLQRWRENGFFDHDFRVWRVGQSRENSILLIDALRLTS